MDDAGMGEGGGQLRPVPALAADISQKYDVEFEMNMDVVEDVPAELEHFIRLARLGLVTGARGYFNEVLKRHLKWFPVFAEFVDFLADRVQHREELPDLCDIADEAHRTFSNEELELLDVYQCLRSIHQQDSPLHLPTIDQMRANEFFTRGPLSPTAAQVIEIVCIRIPDMLSLDEQQTLATSYFDWALEQDEIWGASRVLAVITVPDSPEFFSTTRRYFHRLLSACLRSNDKQVAFFTIANACTTWTVRVIGWYWRRELRADVDYTSFNIHLFWDLLEIQFISGALLGALLQSTSTGACFEAWIEGVKGLADVGEALIRSIIVEGQEAAVTPSNEEHADRQSLLATWFDGSKLLQQKQLELLAIISLSEQESTIWVGISDLDIRDELLRQTLEECTARIGHSHPTIMCLLENLASIYVVQGRQDMSKNLTQQLLGVTSQISASIEAATTDPAGLNSSGCETGSILPGSETAATDLTYEVSPLVEKSKVLEKAEPPELGMSNLDPENPENINIFLITPDQALKLLTNFVERLARITGDVPVPALPAAPAKRARGDLPTPSGSPEETSSHTIARPPIVLPKRLVGTDTSPPYDAAEEYARDTASIVGADAEPIYVQQHIISRKFWSKRPPSYAIMDYLLRLHKWCAMSVAVYLAAAYYIRRLAVQDRLLPVTPRTVHRIVLTALRVSQKAHEDMAWPHKRYAKVAGITERELGRLEISFVLLLGFELRIDDSVLTREAQDLARSAFGTYHSVLDDLEGLTLKLPSESRDFKEYRREKGGTAPKIKRVREETVPEWSSKTLVKSGMDL